MKLGEILVHSAAITQSILDAALEKQRASKMRVGEILIEHGWIDDRQLAEALSRQLGLPFVSLHHLRPAAGVVRAIPEAVAQRLDVVPLAISENGRLSIAMSDPLDILALDELKMIAGAEVDINVAALSDVKRALVALYKVRTSLEDAIVEVSTNANWGREEDAAAVSADAAPVVRLVGSLLEQAVKERASDVHLEASENGARVRFRVDGALYDAAEIPRSLYPAVVSRLKIVAGMDISERRRPQDGRMVMKTGGHKIDFRVSSLPAIYGEKIVIRLLDPSAAKIGLNKLGLYPEEVGLLRKITAVPYGMSLVTGPTGSGKSTTLYSLLETINTPDVNIITVEDPVEYTVQGVNQIQVNEKTGLTFSEALRSILRQDPDKIMVGEIRDAETAELAVRAALTGHLVLSTLHTNDAPSSVMRLIDMGVQPFLLSASLIAVTAQRLVRKLCARCKTAYEVSASAVAATGIREGTIVYAAKGCDDCRGTGYNGRTCVVEIMMIDDELRAMIGESASVGKMREAAVGKGMSTLLHGARRKVEDGITSIEEMMTIVMQR